ncbi:MAG: nitrous oxide reductase accessory protein NosL [Phycisphaerae bacterium]|nr:nitrous oxide reductase accessory protein NosL [Phycisphaerae bacterium]
MLSASLLLPVACGDAGPKGPPTIRLGRDECVECGMMINEDRCSAASIVEGEEGREYRLFDDIGCLLDWERDHAEEAVEIRFVRDYGTRVWCDASVAGFLDGAEVRTPMASGLLGFTDAVVAEAARANHGGQVLSWDELQAARLAWLARRDAAYRSIPDTDGTRPASEE